MNFTFTFSFLGLVKVKTHPHFRFCLYARPRVMVHDSIVAERLQGKIAKRHCVFVHGLSAADLIVPSEEGGTLCGDCFHQRVRLYTNPGMDLSIHKYPIRMETCVYGELLIRRGQFFYTTMQGPILLL